MSTGISEMLLDRRLDGLLAKYIGSDEEPEEAFRDRHTFLAARLKAERFVLPVTGVQGCGKSTLLNALLFDRPVLPIDADETTCVPVEIGWAKKASRQALVKYRDGRTEEIAASQESLAPIVDNRLNHGNTLGVDRVIVQSSSPLLSQGFILVDLPGTGSLTRNNLRTTEQYLEEAVGIFYLLRTVPPLTRSESTFVGLNWSRLPLAIFAQNWWMDESQEECKDGLAHNVAVLKQLAERCRIRLEGNPEIMVVNAYNALKASLTGDVQLARTSGLEELRNTLMRFSSDWPQRVADSVTSVLRTEIESCSERIDDELGLARSSVEDGRQKLASQQAQFDEYIARASEKCDKAQAEIESNKLKSLDGLRRWSKDSETSLRNNMRTKMRAGIVDGPRLDRALREEEEVALDSIYESLLEDTLTLDDRLRIEFENLPEWNMKKPESSFRIVERPEKPKTENLAHKVLSAGGAIGGTIGGAKAGAALGAAIGTVVPGIGNVIGGILGGVLGGLLGAFLGGAAGKGIKSAVTAERAKAAEPEVFHAIEEFVEETGKALESQVGKCSSDLAEGILIWKKKQINDFEKERARMTESFLAEDKEKEDRIRDLLSDRDAINQYLVTLGGM